MSNTLVGAPKGDNSADTRILVSRTIRGFRILALLATAFCPGRRDLGVDFIHRHGIQAGRHRICLESGQGALSIGLPDGGKRVFERLCIHLDHERPRSSVVGDHHLALGRKGLPDLRGSGAQVADGYLFHAFSP